MENTPFTRADSFSALEGPFRYKIRTLPSGECSMPPQSFGDIAMQCTDSCFCAIPFRFPVSKKPQKTTKTHKRSNLFCECQRSRTPFVNFHDSSQIIHNFTICKQRVSTCCNESTARLTYSRVCNRSPAQVGDPDLEELAPHRPTLVSERTVRTLP
jgi:hypothetical protein